MQVTLRDLLLDPAFRAPILGSLLIGIIAGLLGSVILLRRQSLLGETLSHACFPGVVLGSILSLFLLQDKSDLASYFLLSGCGAVFSLLAQKMLLYLTEKKRVKEDSALLIVLSGFFGVGVLLSSYLQFEYPGQYKLSLSYLYGQTATLNDGHLFLYATFFVLVAVFFFFFTPVVEMKIFDREYFISIYGKTAVWFQRALWALITLAIVFGIRSLGVVLMSALLITPSLTAYLLCERFSSILLLSAFFGALSTLLGNIFSLYGTLFFSGERPGFSIPTGPSIVLVAFFFFFLALLFSPKNGLLIRSRRILCFRIQSVEENLLKTIWREPEGKATFHFLAHRLRMWPPLLRYFVKRIKRRGMIEESCGYFILTSTGKLRAEHIIRLHRLWELYLVECMKVGKERVHISAEQMEHVLTPELEKKLSTILNDPKEDPHKSPIPKPNGEQSS